MSSLRFLVVALTVAAVMALQPRAEAFPITFHFAGIITSVDDQDNVLEGAVQAGHPFSGNCTFDSTLLDLRPSDPTIGLYGPPGPEISMDVDTLSLLISSGDVGISVANKSYGDSFTIAQVGQLQADELTILELGVSLNDARGAVFDDDSLPLAPPELNAFQSRQLRIQGEKPGSRDLFIYGDVTMLTPEPRSAALLLASFALVVGYKTRSARRSRLP